MRIFLALHPSGNLSVPGSMTWYHNLYEPLIDLGHEVVLLRLDQVAKKHNIRFRGSKFKEVFSNELVIAVKNEHFVKPIDLFFSYLTDKDIDTGALKAIKSLSVPMVNFSCNNTHQFSLVENISSLFDFNLHSEKDADIKFRVLGANPVWFPMAANPRYYFPIKGEYIYDTSFIGAAYAKRSFYVDYLVQNGINVDCFGPNWLINKPFSNLKKYKREADRLRWLLQSITTISPGTRKNLSLKIYNHDFLKNLREMNSNRFHYPVRDNEMPAIFSQTKVNLGFLEVYLYDNHQIVQKHLHLREFEVPMCGGLYITNYSEELSEFYDLDKELLVFYNEIDLADKIKYYLKHDNEADTIRKRSFARALKDHTYQKRFTELFLKINLKD